ncbi:MAG: hypothetical protein ACOY99_05370 [Pseudomonadota bacterium]
MAAQADIDALFGDGAAPEEAEAAPLPFHAETRLATDFLNQYNEVTMTLEMLGDMPDLLSEIAHWRPKTYVEHFEASGFHDKKLVIAAYETAPGRFRLAFDLCVDELNAVLLEGLAALGQPCDDASLADQADAILALASRLVARLNAIIHGNDQTSDQAAIDALMASADDAGAAGQADIDALFD